MDKNESEADQIKIILIIKILISKITEMSIEERKRRKKISVYWTKFARCFSAAKFSLIPAIVLI